MQYLTLVRSAPLIVSYESYVLQGLNMDTNAIPHMSSGQKIYVKFKAMHKLGSSPIGCEDFNIPGSITNGVSV